MKKTITSISSYTLLYYSLMLIRSHGWFSYKFQRRPTSNYQRDSQHIEWNFDFKRSFNWKVYSYIIDGFLILFIIWTIRDSISLMNTILDDAGYTHTLVMNLHNIFEISLLISLFFASGISSKKLRNALKAIWVTKIQLIQKKGEVLFCLRQILLAFFIQKLLVIIGFSIIIILRFYSGLQRELLSCIIFTELEFSFSLFSLAAFELVNARYSIIFDSLAAFNGTRTICEISYKKICSCKMTELQNNLPAGNIHDGTVNTLDNKMRTHQLLMAVRSANYRLMQIYSVRVRLQSFIGQPIAAILLHVVIGVILSIFSFFIVERIGERIEYVAFILPNLTLLFFVVYIPSLVEPKVIKL